MVVTKEEVAGLIGDIVPSDTELAMRVEAMFERASKEGVEPSSPPKPRCPYCGSLLQEIQDGTIIRKWECDTCTIPQ